MAALQISAGLLSVGAIVAQWTHRCSIARAFAVEQVTLIIWGWASAQFPYLVVPNITIFNAAAPPATLRLLLVALVVGALALFPSFYYLFRVFKGKQHSV